MSISELNVPDIGDFDAVEVIEILVAVGDTIVPEQGLVTVESDKASMEIPADRGGVVREILVKIGDKVSEGSPLARITEESGAKAQGPDAVTATESPAGAADMDASDPAASEHAETSAQATGAQAHEAPAAEGAAGAAQLDCDVLVLGAGPGGYSAAFRAADLGLDVILVERHSSLGGVCLNVGCIPSKALLHSVSVLEEAKALAAHGIRFSEPEIDLDALRKHKDTVVNRLTTGLAGMARARKVTVLTGEGRFADANHLHVRATDGATTILQFRSAIIAAGSEAVQLPFLPRDPRVVDSTGALALAAIPRRMLIIGGGIIGLEMGTVYSALGARLDVVEMLPALMTGADRDLARVWEKRNAWRFDHIMLNTRTVAAEATAEGILVHFEGAGAPAEPQRYDLVLQAVGRRPNGQKLDAQKAGVHVTEQGFIPVDQQMRTNVPHIHAIGDIVGQPMLAHKAVHEGHVAAEVIAGQKSFFDARVIPSVAYTDPEVAWVGLGEDEARKEGVVVRKGLFPWQASGRAIANGRDEGFTKLLFDADSGRILGGGIVGTHAGDLIGEVALAIEMGADSVDIGQTIHPHPTLGESIGMAAEAADGHCTDLPPVRRR
ncbi:dihydrolipoyl dehydrogenase [Castellaniella sp.]|uniref:dihydrolipoyl dehydrogenase n=1 Tax=Castellaniella sp. TaxID=1955812 RepID=UPI003560A30E